MGKKKCASFPILYILPYHFYKAKSSDSQICVYYKLNICALNWKRVDGPIIGMWVKEMASNMSIEKIMYIVRRKQNVFDNIWGPFRYFLRHNTNVGNSLQQEQALGE